tara:strand:+ start:1201 stop:1602 length:402 start_codon:yes stop_codon:yes gene_type:complete
MSQAEVFRWPVRVYWEDTDASGVVYHANYLRWFERARTEWLRAKGFNQDALCAELGIAFTVASLDVRYLLPARMDDALLIEVSVEGRKRASLNFVQRALRSEGEQLLAQARVRVACVDASSFRPLPLPDLGLQ